MKGCRYASFDFSTGRKNKLETIAEGVERALHGLGLSIKVETSQIEQGDKEKIQFEFFQDSDRVCYECGEKAKRFEPDPCLGNLPGVTSACCGHGNPNKAYVQFTNGVVFRGFNKIERSED